MQREPLEKLRENHPNGDGYLYYFLCKNSMHPMDINGDFDSELPFHRTELKIIERNEFGNELEIIIPLIGKNMFNIDYIDMNGSKFKELNYGEGITEMLCNSLHISDNDLHCYFNILFKNVRPTIVESFDPRPDSWKK